MRHLLRPVVALGILAVPAVAGAQDTGGIKIKFNADSADIAFFGVKHLNEVVAFQPEGLLALPDPQSSVKPKFDALQFPLLGRFRLGKGSPVAVLAGPSLAVRLRVLYDERGHPNEYIVNFRDDETFDFGYVAGVELSDEHVVLEGRCTWGLPTIAQSIAPEASGNRSANRRVLSFSTGWRF